MVLLTPFQALLSRYLLRLQGENEVARFDDIILADTQDSALFRSAVPSALQLIKNLDSRRFRRLRRYVKWIVNCPLPYGGGQYHYLTRTCRLDIEKTTKEPDPDYAAAAVASTLIHEATHGALRARAIGYTAELRSRVERCCVREQNRFLARLSSTRPDIANSLYRDFSELRWHRSWTTDIVVAGAVGEYPLAFSRTSNSRNAWIGGFGWAGQDGMYIFAKIPVGDYYLEVWADPKTPLVYPIHVASPRTDVAPINIP